MPPPPTDHVRPPRKLLWAAEVPRAAIGAVRLFAAGRKLSEVPHGDRRPILLLPGLFNSDRSNTALRRHLERTGYDASGWGLGRNFGARTIGKDGSRLFERVEQRAQEAGAPVTLIGVSLGGMMARLAAHQVPASVRAVITVASPYAGHPRATNVWRAFEWVTREKVDSPAVTERLVEMRAPLPVPAAAIWSRSDGLVNGAICRADDCPAVEVNSSHMGVQFHPDTLRAVSELLPTL